jgi:hypothetical protein
VPHSSAFFAEGWEAREHGETVIKASRKKLPSPLNCYPEAAQSRAKRATPNEGSVYFISEHTGSIWADTDLLRTDLRRTDLPRKDKKAELANVMRFRTTTAASWPDQKAYSGKKAVAPEIMTVKN